MKGRAGGVRRSPRRRKRSVTSKPRALYIRTSLWARKSPACPAVRSPRNASEKQRNLRCEPSCKAWSSAPTIPAPLTAKMAALSTSAFTGKALVAKAQIRAKASKASVVVKASASDIPIIRSSGARPGYAAFARPREPMPGSQSIH